MATVHRHLHQACPTFALDLHLANLGLCFLHLGLHFLRLFHHVAKVVHIAPLFLFILFRV
jgi:hypothetical protein